MVAKIPTNVYRHGVEDNIRLRRNDATFEDIVNAAKLVTNAHSFIERLALGIL